MNKSTRIPPITPLRFIPANKELPEGMNTWPFDQGFFYQHIKKYFQQKANYNQKFTLKDKVVVYCDSLAPLIDIYIVDDNGAWVADVATSLVYVAAIVGNTDSYYGQQYYSFAKDFTFEGLTLPEGFYFVVIKTKYAGDAEPDVDTHFVSECIHVKASWPTTALIQYANDINNYDVIFEAGGFLFVPWQFRAEMIIDEDPASSDVVFENQNYELESLQSVPYRVAELIVGGAGVPTWVLDKINRILACTTFAIDNVQYKKEVDAKWTFKKAENSALKSGRIMLRDNPDTPAWEFNNGDTPDYFSIHDVTYDSTYD